MEYHSDTKRDEKQQHNLTIAACLNPYGGCLPSEINVKYTGVKNKLMGSHSNSYRSIYTGLRSITTKPPSFIDHTRPKSSCI